MEISKTQSEVKNLQLNKKKSTIYDKVTHLYLQEKHLLKIPKLSHSHELQTLYLYSNNITKIENLDGFTSLTSLYLQGNKIEKIENLNDLHKLKKLYLGKNQIGVLEGLECIDALEELHIEKQNLIHNTPLCFDPRTIISISQTLQVLNVSHNNICSLQFLAPLENLTVIDASCNDLDDIKDVCKTLRNWFYLKEAKFSGNPISKKHRYREDIIANTYHLNLLDNKSISDLNRCFIRRFEEGKLICKTKPSINIADVVPGLPKNYPTTLQKAASASIMKEFRCRQLEDLTAFDDAEPVYLSWNLLPKRKPLVAPPSQSLLRGHKMESQKNILVSKSTIKVRKHF
ncbi:protein phosphatase 1 regulatory subunit 42-like [Anthonomus grandis grandis]|uniref:protein phosphatase 1 regulatory subunit 42-like n=1 Tax=Anthonomus grandis grandis TaxID=2921223 RepID=UPI00216528E6|nr:protein phosphatase 1 regulatory subunit 42-like [Anthonomus grandis grandis]